MLLHTNFKKKGLSMSKIEIERNIALCSCGNYERETKKKSVVQLCDMKKGVSLKLH